MVKITQGSGCWRCLPSLAQTLVLILSPQPLPQSFPQWIVEGNQPILIATSGPRQAVADPRSFGHLQPASRRRPAWRPCKTKMAAETNVPLDYPGSGSCTWRDVLLESCGLKLLESKVSLLCVLTCSEPVPRECRQHQYDGQHGFANMSASSIVQQMLKVHPTPYGNYQ